MCSTSREMDGQSTVLLQFTTFCFFVRRSSPTPKSLISNIPIRQCLRQRRTSCGITDTKNSCSSGDYTGINESTYIHYENPEHDYYPVDKLYRIAKLLKVDINDLLDKYNRSLYDRQGWQIQKIRKSMELTQYQFGKLYVVSSGAIKQWKSEGDIFNIWQTEF